MKTFLVVGAAALASLSLGACSTLGGVPGAPAGGASLADSLDKFNAAVASHCSGDAHFTYAPPLPPSGSANINCEKTPPPPPAPPTS
jgi:hypothetical protein